MVKAQWLRLEQRECEGKLRSYTLLEAETLLIVNHMVRLAGLRFSPGRPCGPPAEERAREALYWPTAHALERVMRKCCTFFRISPLGRANKNYYPRYCAHYGSEGCVQCGE